MKQPDGDELFKDKTHLDIFFDGPRGRDLRLCLVHAVLSFAIAVGVILIFLHFLIQGHG